MLISQTLGGQVCFSQEKNEKGVGLRGRYVESKGKKIGMEIRKLQRGEFEGKVHCICLAWRQLMHLPRFFFSFILSLLRSS